MWHILWYVQTWFSWGDAYAIRKIFQIIYTAVALSAYFVVLKCCKFFDKSGVDFLEGMSTQSEKLSKSSTVALSADFVVVKCCKNSDESSVDFLEEMITLLSEESREILDLTEITEPSSNIYATDRNAKHECIEDLTNILWFL